MKFSKKDVFTIPNILTYVRIICIPFFVWMMSEYYLDRQATQYLWAGFGLFVFASITDVVDGYIARHFNQVSDIGKVLDPIADKVLQCVALIMLVCVLQGIYFIFMALLIVKEVYMGVSSRYFMVKSKSQINQQSNKWGKAGAAINFVGIVLAFVVPLKDVAGYDWARYVYVADVGILSAGMVLAVIAAAQYTYLYSRDLKRLRESGALDDTKVGVEVVDEQVEQPNSEPKSDLDKDSTDNV
ncbi:MAG: CDP-diacylglycerol--glycerol-3-phosphate 3-phosphatidyltransferase [Christensenellales bacterium]